MGDQRAVGVDDVGEPGRADLDPRDDVPDELRLTSAAVTPPPLPAGRAIVMYGSVPLRK